MTKVQKTVEVEQATQSVMDALNGIVSATKKALADGFQAGQDLPAIVAEAWKDLPPAIAQFNQLPADAKEDVRAFVRTLGLGVGELAGVLLEPSAPAAAPAPTA